LKLSLRGNLVEIHSVADEQILHFKLSGDGASFERAIRFADLQNPNVWLREFGGNPADGLFGNFDLPALPSSPAAGDLHWEAHRDRVMIGREPISAYRLETVVLGHPVVIYTSLIGEILCVKLPGGITASLDEWVKQ
jgi:hypothetical protein